MQLVTPPKVILSHPQLGENIGAAARVMKNFGLSDLRIVNPRDGWPNKAATYMATGGKDIIETAKVGDDLREMLSDCTKVYATTASLRELDLPVITPREAFQGNHEQIGLLFGREATGLENNEIAHADAVLSIPVAPDYTSLNLAQAVAVCCYEWHTHHFENTISSEPIYATKHDLEGIYTHLIEELDKKNYFRVPAKRPKMERNIRSMIQKMQFTPDEADSFRGLIRVLSTWDER